jgi:hypothetical protein
MMQFPFSFFSGGRELLPETLAYATASGATDLVPLNNLFGYIISESLWNNFRIYPQKSAQNAGSGSTVFGAGALTSNNGTLIGSPTRGADGITFNTSTQLMRIADFLGSETLTVWIRRNGSILNGTSAINQVDTGANQRSWGLNESTPVADGIALTRSSTGALADQEIYRSSANQFPTSDSCIVAQWIDGGARFCWVNNASVDVTTLTSGTNQTSRLNSSADITQNARLNNNSPDGFMGGQYTALCFLAGPTPTTTQRETITNLINAL